jgi:hypothetical protein
MKGKKVPRQKVPRKKLHGVLSFTSNKDTETLTREALEAAGFTVDCTDLSISRNEPNLCETYVLSGGRVYMVSWAEMKKFIERCDLRVNDENTIGDIIAERNPRVSVDFETPIEQTGKFRWAHNLNLSDEDVVFKWAKGMVKRK